MVPKEKKVLAISKLYPLYSLLRAFIRHALGVCKGSAVSFKRTTLQKKEIVTANGENIMKRLTLLGVLGCLTIGGASATALPAPCLQQTTLAALMALGSCYYSTGTTAQDDKIFSNFTYSLGDAANVEADLDTAPSYGWSFKHTGGVAWSSDFTLSFDVEVITNSGSGTYTDGSTTAAINRTLDQMNAGPSTVGISIVDSQCGSSQPLGNACTTPVTTSQTLNMTAASNFPFNETAAAQWPAEDHVHVSSTTSGISATNGLISYEQDFGQAPVPEPATYLLLGGALFGLGFWKRRKA